MQKFQGHLPVTVSLLSLLTLYTYITLGLLCLAGFLLSQRLAALHTHITLMLPPHPWHALAPFVSEPFTYILISCPAPLSVQDHP